MDFELTHRQKEIQRRTQEFVLREFSKEKALELAIGQIEKRFGKGSIMKLGESVAQTFGKGASMDDGEWAGDDIVRALATLSPADRALVRDFITLLQERSGRAPRDLSLPPERAWRETPDRR